MTKLPQSARFISFEGIDGCGKSTILAQLSTWLEEAGIAHIRTREPGGTRLGESLRTILLDPANAGMSSWTEALLYGASRAQHVKDVIEPTLRSGAWVLSDRYVDATIAYQGYGRGLDPQGLHRIHEWTTAGTWPHCTILLNCDIVTAFERMRGRSGAPDRLEQQDSAFHERVRAGYLALAEAEPNRFLVLDASRPLEEVVSEFQRRIGERFGIPWKVGGPAGPRT